MGHLRPEWRHTSDDVTMTIVGTWAKNNVIFNLGHLNPKWRHKDDKDIWAQNNVIFLRWATWAPNEVP